jgi:preprotein translocase subunit Sss1
MELGEMLAGAIGLLVLGFLGYALLFPERF